MATPEYKAYMNLVKKNAQSLANALLRRKCRLVTGGTDNHLLLWDLTALGITGIILITSPVFTEVGFKNYMSAYLSTSMFTSQSIFQYIIAFISLTEAVLL